ncbi:hypothetical protein B0A49_06505 [Cryomyces minteri]|uniref:MAPEG family protein n=1 Tax=Cryomyces minteri TaxID=331657 RepID=A0A4U0WVR1_9PEZI|nr:hypothetical protein B0A49_06505 [Cryomyces minteri]
MSSLVDRSLLAPVVALNIWTFVMEGWMYATRLPAVSKYNLKVDPNATSAQFNAQIPPHIRWKADNYNHLLEQPTQFYAVMAVLALLGRGNAMALERKLAWGYVGLRVVHSLVQAIGNKIMVRFSVFVGSSAVLAGLTARAAMLVF